MNLAFLPEEYTMRQNQLIARMAEEKLDAVVLFAQESLYWLTGLDTFGYCFFQCLIMTPDGQKTLLTRLPDFYQAEQTPTIENVVIWHDRENANPARDLRDLLNGFDLLGKRVGLEYQTPGLTAADGHLIEEQLTSFCKLVDISSIVDHLRLIKSKQEIGYIKKAAELSDNIFDEALNVIAKKTSESDILAAMINTNIAGDGDFAANDYFIGSGPNALWCRSTNGRRKLLTNDQITLEWSGAYRRYHAPMVRTVLTGKTTKRHEELFNAGLDAMLAIEQQLKPGKTFSDPFDAYVQTLESHDVTRYRFNTCGYSVGASFAPSWAERQQFQLGNETEIKTDMTLFASVMLFDTESQTAMTLARTYLITAEGNESLSRHALDLIVK